MNESLPPEKQVHIAYVALGNALRYGPDMVSTTDAEKWLDFLYGYAKYGAATERASRQREQEDMSRGD